MELSNTNRRSEIIGLIPAGGQASRIAPLPCSKEIFPIGFQTTGDEQERRPRAVCHYLLENMRLAGARKAYIILRKGKWDIPAYLGDGEMLDMHLAYLMMNLPYGPPYTLDQAYPFVQDALVLFGFPDIVFQPQDAFVQLQQRQAETAADIVLGLFPTRQPQTADMVELDAQGRACRIIIKPAQTSLRYTWIIAIWTQVFSQFMHEYLLDQQVETGNARQELHVGHVIQAAIEQQLYVETLTFSEGTYLDIGTPASLLQAIQELRKVS